MRTTTSRSRLTLALAGASLLILLAGCTADAGDSGGGGELSSGTEEQAFDEWNAAFDECMKEQGVDLEQFRTQASTGDGEGEADQQASVTVPDDLDMELFEAANETCLTEVGDPPAQPGAPDEEELQATMLAFAECMREAGYDYPDPEFSGNGAVAAMPADEYDPADVDHCSEMAGLGEARG